VPSSALCASPDATGSSALRTAWTVAPAIGSPLLPTTRPRITFSGARRKLCAVVPAFSIRRSTISVASVGRLTRTK
jgi:hypothetical protein